MSEKDYTLYVLEAEGGRLYAGIALDVQARFEQHKSGKGARFTRSFRPVKIKACWQIGGGRGSAQRAEAWFKKLPRDKKLAALEGQHEFAGTLSSILGGEAVRCVYDNSML